MPHKSLEKCIYCGAETQLYVNARPVCPERLLDIESSRAKQPKGPAVQIPTCRERN